MKGMHGSSSILVHGLVRGSVCARIARCAMLHQRSCRVGWMIGRWLHIRVKICGGWGRLHGTEGAGVHDGAKGLRGASLGVWVGGGHMVLWAQRCFSCWAHAVVYFFNPTHCESTSLQACPTLHTRLHAHTQIHPLHSPHPHHTYQPPPPPHTGRY